MIRLLTTSSKSSHLLPEVPTMGESSRLLDLGFEIVGNPPEQSTEFQATEFARWKKVIEVGKVKAD